MRYDPSTQALLHPESLARAPDPALFADKPDALCAELSRLAYLRFEGGPDALTRALAAHGLVAPVLLGRQGAGSEAFATHDGDGTAWVVFRGAQGDSWDDILSDTNAVPVGWRAGMVHWGFARRYEALREQVTDWIEACECTHLVATGHSLGAALATLLAGERSEAELVTFGSPRVGNAAFAGLFEDREVRRYVNCSDGITSLPPPGVYRHVAPPRYIERHGKVGDDPGTIAMAKDRAAAKAAYVTRYMRSGNAPLRAAADHAPVNYLSALLGLRED